jgi:hypothetical protein
MNKIYYDENWYSLMNSDGDISMKQVVNVLLLTALAAPLLVLTGCSSEPYDKLGTTYGAE